MVKTAKKSQNGFKMAEIYTNNHFDHEGGTSVDDSDEDISDIGSPPKTKLIIGAPVGESNDYDSDSDLLKKSSRNAIFGQAEQVLHKVLDHIDQAQKNLQSAARRCPTWYSSATKVQRILCQSKRTADK